MTGLLSDAVKPGAPLTVHSSKHKRLASDLRLDGEQQWDEFRGCQADSGPPRPDRRRARPNQTMAAYNKRDYHGLSSNAAVTRNHSQSSTMRADERGAHGLSLTSTIYPRARVSVPVTSLSFPLDCTKKESSLSVCFLQGLPRPCSVSRSDLGRLSFSFSSIQCSILEPVFEVFFLLALAFTQTGRLSGSDDVGWESRLGKPHRSVLSARRCLREADHVL